MNGKQSKKLGVHARLVGLARGAIDSRVAEPLRQLGITPAAQVIFDGQRQGIGQNGALVDFQVQGLLYQG